MTYLKEKQAAIVAVFIGALVSLAIEYFQSWLPTRFSGLTDIATNTFGTALGAAIFLFAVRVVDKKIRVEQSSAQPG
jgi:VanZ family protein